eukprot:TRINITY_DN29678_c0_g3_i1.p2 TRINITY_DN29678_c0_g3~~TRINITY_DN29678_c0_g3_i1.p2  ORF type:complete len:190 (+),score=17.46 TRINITY_DN29678_c0_g3_i1:133-702(+)
MKLSNFKHQNFLKHKYMQLKIIRNVSQTKMCLNEKSKQNIKIRKGSSNDVEQMCDQMKQLLEQEKDFSYDRQKQAAGYQMLFAEESNGVAFVAQNEDDNDKVVGMITVQRLISTVQGTYVGLVEDFIVDTNYRGCGIGQLLMEECEKYAVQNKWTRLTLLTDADNERGQKFYKRNGWENSQMIVLRKFI